MPKDDELARFIESLDSDYTFRCLIIALNTACLPEAALDLGPGQIDVENRLVDLNPEGVRRSPASTAPLCGSPRTSGDGRRRYRR